MTANQLSSTKPYAIDSNRPVATAYFASGCFWGTEYFFMQATGVITTHVGYMGGHLDNPNYDAVCSGETGHFEAVRIHYDEDQTSYEALLRLFFETHDFAQTDGQGPDIGPQYRSCIFYQNETEYSLAEACIATLKTQGYAVATLLRPFSTFWQAEDYHQQYYQHRNTTPYCHVYRKIFVGD